VTGWLQINVALPHGSEKPVRAHAHDLFASLGSDLPAWRTSGSVTAFVFQRKPPDVRLRFEGPEPERIEELVRPVLERAERASTIELWFVSPYEPELRKLGGAEASDAFHRWGDVDTSLWLAFDAWWAGTGARTVPDELAVAAPIVAATLDTLALASISDRDEIWDAWCNLCALASGGDESADPALVSAVTGMPLSTEAVALGGEDPRCPAAELHDAVVRAHEAGRSCAHQLQRVTEQGDLTTGLRAAFSFAAQLSLQRWGLDASGQRAVADAMARRYDPRRGLRGSSIE
jgi:hypothetical protein